MTKHILLILSAMLWNTAAAAGPTVSRSVEPQHVHVWFGIAAAVDTYFGADNHTGILGSLDSRVDPVDLKDFTYNYEARVGVDVNGDGVVGRPLDRSADTSGADDDLWVMPCGPAFPECMVLFEVSGAESALASRETGPHKTDLQDTNEVVDGMMGR